MATDDDVNGGSKLITAGLLMTLGVGGALLFRQDPNAPSRAESSRVVTTASELLVRRSNVPAVGSFEGPAAPRAPQPAISVPTSGAPASSVAGMAQITGTIDPFRVEGARAATQGRLTAEYGRPTTPTNAGIGTAPPPPYGPSGSPYGMPGIGGANSAAAYAPSYLFVDPTSESERTPLNNVTPRVELPAEYPGLRRAEGADSRSSNGLPLDGSGGASNRSAADMSPVANSSAAARAGASSAIAFPSNVSSSNSAASIRTPSNLVGAGPDRGEFAPSRAVMPTLHAGSGQVAPAPVAPAAPEPMRSRGSNSRRHKVRDGDTLASLAEAYYGDAERYTAIYEANRAMLSNPDVLTIGTYLLIPPADEAAATTAAAAANPPPAARLLPRVQIRPLGE